MSGPRPKKTLQSINALIEVARRTAFKGIGKPGQIKGDLSGGWSRRITDGHRFVYRISGTGDAQSLQIAQLRYRC